MVALNLEIYKSLRIKKLSTNFCVPDSETSNPNWSQYNVICYRPKMLNTSLNSWQWHVKNYYFCSQAVINITAVILKHCVASLRKIIYFLKSRSVVLRIFKLNFLCQKSSLTDGLSDLKILDCEKNFFFLIFCIYLVKSSPIFVSSTQKKKNSFKLGQF